MIVAEYAFNIDAYSDLTHVVAFMTVNSVNFLVPISKYIIIWYEGELPWGDCGIFDCLFALDSYVG